MSSIGVAVKIWAETVFLNALFCGIWVVFSGEIFDVFMSALFLFGGFIATLPLLLPFFLLIHVSKKVPYSVRARFSWLIFYLVLIVCVYCWVLSNVDAHNFWELHSYKRCLIFCMVASLLIVVFATRKSLYKLYEGS
jgi:hypothetical protein